MRKARAAGSPEYAVGEIASSASVEGDFVTNHKVSCCYENVGAHFGVGGRIVGVMIGRALDRSSYAFFPSCPCAHISTSSALTRKYLR